MPTAKSVASLVLATTSWASFLYAQGTAGTAGGGPAPAAPAATEAVPPPRSALPDTGTAPPKTPGTQPGGTQPGTTPQASPFALPAPATPEEKQKSSPFGRQNSGASSLFGTQLNQPGETDTTGVTPDTGGPKPLEAPTTFSASGFYGSGGVSLTTGTGRLAKPRRKYSVTAGMGFDDNTQQAPTDSLGTEEQVFRQVIPGQSEISTIVQRRVPTGEFRPINGSFVPVFRTVSQKVILRPFVAEQEIVQRIPGFPGRDRESSVISQISGSYQAQWAKGRRAFTMDARAGVDYYWSRSTDPLEYQGSMSLLYIRRFSPRLQVSTAVTASYQTQPDFSRLNAAADAQVSGASTLASSKTDLTYRWNRHLSTVTSLSADLRQQENGASNGTGGAGSSYTSYGLGQEFRYLWSPKLTYVAELRYSLVDYLDSDSGSKTVSLLAGADWDVTRRLRATTRLGESIRSFDPVGTKSASPYGEFTLSYQPSRKDTYTASSRYGFEESSIPGAEQLVFRTSLSYQRLFNPKFVGSASLNRISYENKSPLGTSSQAVLDASLGLKYIFSRKFNMGASYNYTDSKTDSGFTDYYKSRLFLTGAYEF